MTTHRSQPQTTATERDRVLAAARRYDQEIAALADRMEAEGETLHNRGAWNAAVWLLRHDTREKLAQFVGEWMLRDERDTTPDGED